MTEKKNPTITEFVDYIESRQWRGPFHSDAMMCRVVDAYGVVMAEFETPSKAADFLEAVAAELKRRVRQSSRKEKGK